MIILGLAGQAGSGKGTVADYLVRRYGFVQFAFSAVLYSEVQAAFGLPDQSLLRDRAGKEEPNDLLRLKNCNDAAFVGVATEAMDKQNREAGLDLYLLPTAVPLSPRQVLQWWGTDYRRAQSAQYWLQKAAGFIAGVQDTYLYPEQAPQFFVESGTRFENEREFITGRYDPPWTGNIWHLHRDATDTFADTHSSAKPLPVLSGERELWNNSTIERLHAGIDLLMSTSARFVRCEPLYRGPWCCERGQALQIPVCSECAEISAAYSATMGPDPQAVL